VAVGGWMLQVMYSGRASCAATATASPQIHSAESLELIEHAFMLFHD
jgi:hypothetical protein